MSSSAIAAFDQSSYKKHTATLCCYGMFHETDDYAVDESNSDI